MEEEMPEMATKNTKASSRKFTLADVTDPPVPDDELIALYRWLDSFEFSKSKKTSAHRDFADGVMVAELVAHYIPTIVNTRNYVRTSTTAKKRANWEHINTHVFRRMGLKVSPALIKEVSEAKPGMIERILRHLNVMLKMGLSAVSAVPKRFENVKPRFLEIPKRAALTSSDDPQSKTKQSAPACRKSQSSTTLKKPGNVSLRKSKDSSHRTSTQSNGRNALKKFSRGDYVDQSSRDKYPPFRPSTENTAPNDESGSNYKDLKKRPQTVDPYPDYDGIPRAQPELTYKESWLSEENGHPLCLVGKRVSEDYVVNNSELIEMDDEEMDEYDIMEYNNEDSEDTDYEFDTDTDTNKNPKRKVKRVVKYEYREEYIVNGSTTTSASYRVPNGNNENITRENYQVPTRKDSKTRAYGFIMGIQGKI